MIVKASRNCLTNAQDEISSRMSRYLRGYRVVRKESCPRGIFLFKEYVMKRILLILMTLTAFSALTSAQQLPLSSYLNANGSLKQGVNGSFDARGFKLSFDDSGAPRFIADGQTSITSSLACDSAWSSDYGAAPQATGNIYTIASSGSVIYIGGKFNSFGNIDANI